MIRTTPRRLAVGLTAAALALAACGSDSNDADEAAEEPAATEAAAEEPAAEEPADEAMEDEAMAESGTIVEVAAAAGDFTTLVAAVEAADLAETLSADGPYTVFAPTDEAFAALPEGLLDALLLPENQEALVEILTYHVLAAEVPSSAVEPGEVATVQGEEITIAVADDGTVTVNEATVIAVDVEASNGVIHVIDSVIVPPSIDPAALLG